MKPLSPKKFYTLSLAQVLKNFVERMVVDISKLLVRLQNIDLDSSFKDQVGNLYTTYKAVVKSIGLMVLL